MPSLEITIPLPPQATRANKRQAHWSQKSRAVKKQRQDAGFAALHALQQAGRKAPNWKHVSILATFHRPQGRPADAGNLIHWLKASEDGLQDAKIIQNDRYVTWLPPKEILGKAAAEPKVVLVITEQP